MSRKRFSESEVIETLAWQGIFVRCFRCRAPFYTPAPGGGMFNLSDKIEREHIHEIALGGPDVPKNCRYSCAPCHKIITNGTNATTAGSSKQRIAKVDRILGLTCTGPKRKIKGRGFDKTKTRKFNGEVVAR